uniref:THAP-type domain-containing protein n=1 Tax=Ixodes ricinus TaxID=34613 RepID=A0A6B0V610_IXORI
MPTGCSVLLCPNRTPQSPLVRAKKLLFHRLPREEPLRGEWCGRISRRDPGQADMRVCSEHFDSDRDYRRLPSVLRDAGQTMKNVYLKPGAVPSLRLPPTAKRLSPAKDPAVPTSKRRRTENDEPVEVDCFEGSAPRVYSFHCRHRPATRDTAVQADLHESPGPALTLRPPVMKDRSVGTGRWLGKRSIGTQWNAFVKVLTTRWVQTEDFETPDSSSTTVGSNSTTTTTTSAVPLQKPGPACAMNPVLSDSDEEEEEEDEDDDNDDPLWEPPTKRGFVKLR